MKVLQYIGVLICCLAFPLAACIIGISWTFLMGSYDVVPFIPSVFSIASGNYVIFKLLDVSNFIDLDEWDKWYNSKWEEWEKRRCQ